MRASKPSASALMGRSPFLRSLRCIAILLFVLDIYVKYKVLLIWQIIHWCAGRLVSAETHAVLSLCRLGRFCLLQLRLADCSLVPMLHSLDKSLQLIGFRVRCRIGLLMTRQLAGVFCLSEWFRRCSDSSVMAIENLSHAPLIIPHVPS
jgi:hypothetical protein